MITPDDIRDQRFLVALRGYDRDEVGAFQEQVASDVANMQARIKELEALLAKERNRASEPAPQPTAGVDKAPDKRDLLKSLGEETTRILVTAEESAREIEHKASQRAREEMEQAKRNAREEKERAQRQAAKTIADAERRRDAIAAVIRDLEAQRDRFVADLTTAVGNVSAVSSDLAKAGEARVAGDETDEEDADSEHAPTGQATVAADPAPDAVPVAEAAPEADPEAAPELELVPDADAGEPEDGAETSAPEPVTASTDTTADESESPSGPVGDVAARRDAALDELRPEMTRTMRRGLQDVQNGVLEAIRTAGDDAALDDLLPDEATLDDLGTQGQSFLTKAYETGLQDAATEVGGTAPAHLVDGARVPAGSATLRAVTSHEVVSALRATLRAGLEADEAPTSLSERVGEVFRDLKGPVLEGLVAQHLDRIYGHGLLDGWQELGVKRIRWQVGDEPRCPEQRCRSNAAEGAVDLGIDFPSGDRVPPAHPGCTCVLVPEDV